MCFYFLTKNKFFIFTGLIFLGFIIFALLKYPVGVKQYKSIKLGMEAAEKAGDSTVWAPPDDKVWENSKFFVYSLGDKRMCIQSDCGTGGYFIECLEGWLSGNKGEDVFDYGLSDAGVDTSKEKIITIADKNGKIVGIYPGATIRNLPYIMLNHRNLVEKNVFDNCRDSLPRILK